MRERFFAIIALLFLLGMFALIMLILFG